MTDTKFRIALQTTGLRVTRPRISVMEVLSHHPHVDTEAVISLVRAAGISVSHQTVYDVLHALTDAGLVRRIQPAGATAHYEMQTHDNHHHLVCRTCDTIVDVDCASDNAPCVTGPSGHGFVIDETEIVFWGRCRDCADTPS